MQTYEQMLEKTSIAHLRALRQLLKKANGVNAQALIAGIDAIELVQALREALQTGEIDKNLIDVARQACKAERELAALHETKA
jgi:DNA-binding phage protein